MLDPFVTAHLARFLDSQVPADEHLDMHARMCARLLEADAEERLWLLDRGWPALLRECEARQAAEEACLAFCARIEAPGQQHVSEHVWMVGARVRLTFFGPPLPELTQARSAYPPRLDGCA